MTRRKTPRYATPTSRGSALTPMMGLRFSQLQFSYRMPYVHASGFQMPDNGPGRYRSITSVRTYRNMSEAVDCSVLNVCLESGLTSISKVYYIWSMPHYLHPAISATTSVSWMPHHGALILERWYRKGTCPQRWLNETSILIPINIF